MRKEERMANKPEGFNNKQASVFYYGAANSVGDCILRCAHSYATLQTYSTLCNTGNRNIARALPPQMLIEELQEVSAKLQATAETIEANAESLSSWKGDHE